MPIETNADRLERIKTDFGNIEGPNIKDYKWLIEQTERTQKLESLLQGNDGMSVKEIRQQFVDLHQSSLHLENRIESAEAVLKFYAANSTYALQINKGEQFYTDIENDRGRRAQMYLRRDSNEGGKNKGPTPN